MSTRAEPARVSAADSAAGTAATLITPTLLRSWPLPSAGSDKSSRGAVLVIGGGRRTPGAALLAGTAALRAGYHVYDRTDIGYLVRTRTSNGWAIAAVRLREAA